MAGGTDAEAGRAYVTLYLRRTGFDQQVQQAAQDAKALESQLSSPPPAQTAPQQTTTEIGITVGGIEKEAAIGAARAAGAAILGKAATIARAAILGQSAAQTAAAASAASLAAAQAATAASSAAVATAAPAAAAGLATTGTAAAGASVGFGAMAAAAAPIVIPLLAIAAVAAAVYVAIFKWDELPGIVKLLLVSLWPLVTLCKAVKLGIDAVRLAISVITAPFRAAAYVVGLFTSAIGAIPGACMAAVNGLLSLPGMAARAATAMAQAVGRGVAAATGYLAALPGRLVAWGSSAVSSVSAAIGAVGKFTAKAGAVGAALAAGIVGPLTAAAKKFADYGQELNDIAEKHDVHVTEAAALMRASEGTGQSVDALAEQMKAGTLDFTRWRQEAAVAGQVLDGPGVASAMALTQAYAALKSSVSGLWIQLGSAVAPAITETTTLMVSAIRAVTTWVGQNKPLIAQVFRIASIVATASAAIASIGGAMIGVGAAMTPLTVVIGAIAGALALVEYRTGTGRGLWAAYGDSVRQVYATTVAYLGQMAAFVGRMFGGIKDAIRGGDMKLATAVAWDGVKVAWTSGLLELDTLTKGMFGSILQPLAAGNWSAAGTGAMLALQIALATGVEQVRQMWSTLQSWLSGTWTSFVNAADAAWVDVLNASDPVLVMMQEKFDQLKAWGKSAFSDVAAYAAGLGAAVSEVGGTVAALLKGLALVSPTAGIAMLAAAASLSSGGSGVANAFETATAYARESMKSDEQKELDRIAKLNARKQALLATGTAGNAATAETIQKQIDDAEAVALAKREAKAAEAQKRKEDRESGLKGRIGTRNMGAIGADAVRTVEGNAARIAAEENIARLKAQQAELDAKTGSDAAANAAKNKKQLDAAIAAAAAARKAAEAKGLKPEDFVKIEKEKAAASGAIAGGSVRFGGAGAGMQAYAPQKKLEDLSKQQIGVLVDLVKQGGEQIVILKDVLKGWGFA